MNNPTATDSRLTGFESIPEIMGRIFDSGNKFPKVRLAFGSDDSPLAFTRAGDKARFPGSVNLTDGRGFGNNVWYGRVTAEGDFQPSRNAANLPRESKAALWALLQRFKAGEAEMVFAEFGKRFGICCCCGRELTNPESVALGIGPICRGKAFG